MTDVAHVPFKRVLTPHKTGAPTEGDDVLALKRVVSRAGTWPWQEFDNKYSYAFAMGLNKPGQNGLKQFQKNIGVPGTGIYDSATHAKGLSYRVPKGLDHEGDPVWDQFSMNLYTSQVVATPAQEIVVEIWKWWDWLVANNPAVHYLQQRPVSELVNRNSPPHLPAYIDCSGTFIYAAWLGGAQSPDREFGFSGYGNTDSLIRSGFTISESDITKYNSNHYIGALYGRATWATDHITAVRSASQVYSMGQESDPRVYNTVHYRPDFLELRAYPVL